MAAEARAPAGLPKGRRLDPRRWSAGTRIAVLLVVAALVPMIVVAFAGISRGREAVESSQLANVAATAQFSAATLSEYLTGVIAQADQLATQPEVVAALLNPDDTPDSPPLDPAVLGSVLISSPDIAGVLLLSRTGTVIEGVPGSTEGSSYGSQGWFYDALGGSPTVSEIVAGTQPSSLSMFVAVPARPPGSAAVGVVAIEVRAEAILWALNRAPHTPGSQVLLISRETVVVGARDHRLRYMALGQLPEAAASFLVSQRGYPVDTIESLEMAGFGTTMTTDTGTITETELPGAGQQIVAFDQVGDRPLWVVVAEPRATFLAPIESLVRQITVAGLVIGLAAVVAAVVLARRVSRPITAITQAAASVERGDDIDGTRLERYTHGHSDIADLARVMQRMVREVAERERRLREQLKALKVEIDHERRAKDVSQVVETDFFRDLEARATQMRARAKGQMRARATGEGSKGTRATPPDDGDVEGSGDVGREGEGGGNP